MLGSAITQARGQAVVTIHSTGDVTRGETGLFVLNTNGPLVWGQAYVNFSVNGTAIPGVDYVPLISPAHIVWVPPPPQCMSCHGAYYGAIKIKTLPDPRGRFFVQPYSVVVTLEPGLGYAIGQPSSATMMINP
jgi:hypothetical protein